MHVEGQKRKYSLYPSNNAIEGMLGKECKYIAILC
jgi:hypothetical protein